MSSSIATSPAGISEVLISVRGARGFDLIVGYRLSEPNQDDLSNYADLVLAAVDTRADGRVVLSVPVMISFGNRSCVGQVGEQLVPGGSSLVVECLNGGSNNVGFVAVLGLDPLRRFPQILLSVSCGVTGARVRGDDLIITSGSPRGGFEEPSVPNPDIVLRWDHGGFTPPYGESDRYAEQCDESAMSNPYAPYRV